jgi:FixJ family two-component response regulator
MTDVRTGIAVRRWHVCRPLAGREVATKLTAAQPGVRVLYMSGHTDMGIIRDGVLDAGIDFLAKPFTSEALISAVDTALAFPPGKPAASEDSAD